MKKETTPTSVRLSFPRLPPQSSPSGKQALTSPGGLLAPLTDPVGNVAGSILSPLGAGIGAMTGSVAEGAATVTSGLQEKAGIPDRGVEKEKAEEAKKNQIGGKDQSSENPLGL